MIPYNLKVFEPIASKYLNNLIGMHYYHKRLFKVQILLDKILYYK